MNTIASYIMALVGMVLSTLVIVSLSTDHWEEYEVLNGTHTDPISLGLWRLCRNNDCFDFSEFEISDALKAVRAFIFMAMLTGLASALFAGRLACGKPDSSVLTIISFFFIPLFLFVGMIIYSALDITQEFPREYPTDDIARTAARVYGYSYIIGWITFILSLIAFVVCFWLNRPKKQPEDA